MAITVTRQPGAVAGVFNPMPLQLETDNYLLQEATFAGRMLEATGPLVQGDTITFAWDIHSITFTCRNSPDLSGTEFRSTGATALADWVSEFLVEKGFRANALFFSDFKIEAFGTSVMIGARVPGTKYGLSFTSSNPNFSETLGGPAPLDEEPRENFLIIAGIEVDGEIVIEMEGKPVENKVEFSLEETLASFLGFYLPSFSLSNIALTTGLIKAYRYFYYELYGNPQVGQFVYHSAQLRALYGGQQQTEFPNGNLASKYFASTGTINFLTTQPREKEAFPGQHEFLFLYNPVETTRIVLIAEIFYTDGSSDVEEVKNITHPNTPYRVYCFPAGPDQLQIETFDTARTVDYYVLHVEFDGFPSVKSEEFTYYINRKQYAHSNQLLFVNPLGGIDTVWCTGEMVHSADFNRDTGRNILPVDYKKSDGELLSYNRNYKYSFELSTGYKSEEYVRYLKSCFNAECVWLVDDGFYHRLAPPSGSQRLASPADDLHGLTFTLQSTFFNKA